MFGLNLYIKVAFVSTFCIPLVLGTTSLVLDLVLIEMADASQNASIFFKCLLHSIYRNTAIKLVIKSPVVG